MDDAALAFVLEEALALLDDGEDPESIAARFPDVSARLLPMLAVVAELRETADEAIEVPIEALKDIGDFLQDRFEDLTD
jgi:hypothetical protein